MSEEEILEEIKNIFLKLTEGEPTPDDEIEARERLIESFKFLRNDTLIHDQADLIEDTINKLENWDTLDLWFKEVNGLAENIRKMLNFRDMEAESELTEFLNDYKEDIESKPETVSKDIDITEIVAQVSEQFKGEIEGLKDTIDLLKKELNKKEERTKEIPQEPEVQEEIPQEPEVQEEIPQEMEIQDEISQEIEVQEEAPKLKSILAPPKIRIPLIKKPQKSLSIKVPIESEEAAIEEIGNIDVDKEMEPKIIIEAPKNQNISQISLDELKKMLEPMEEPQITAETIEKSELTPIIMEEPSNESISEIPFESPIESPIETESDEEEVKLKPLPVKKPKIIQSITETSKAPEKSKLTSIPFEMPELTQELKSIPFEMPELTQEIKEETKIEEKEESIPSIFPSKKPKIIPIDVEEIDTESIKSSGKDLFNVFSSVGLETPEKSAESVKSTEKINSKGKKKKAEKKKLIVEVPQEIKPVPSTVVDALKPKKGDVDTLPTDKDSLYQELIALEGRRYALEKGYKELSNNYNSGMIDDYEYKNQSEGLRSNLDEISSRIAKIRRLISSL